MEEFKKITELNFEEFLESNRAEWLPERVEFFLYPKKIDYEFSLELSLVDCESPIEQLLALELEASNITSFKFFNPFIDVEEIIKQANIIINNKKYRVDFLIIVDYKNQGKKQFVIECDGYEFHQKTKKQVEDDNKRQRALQAAGYEVIRFSGSEIYNKPFLCALEIKDIILSNCEYKKKG